MKGSRATTPYNDAAARLPFVSLTYLLSLFLLVVGGGSTSGLGLLLRNNLQVATG
jgi:hypothetical protein